MRSMAGRAVSAACALLMAGTVAAQSSRTQNEQRREEWQKVPDIFAAMLVRPGAVVADVGAGDGFFTSRLSAAVGAQGRVIAVDVGADALSRLRQRVKDESLANVEVVEGALDDPRLPAGSVDAILIVNAYHEMTQYKSMLAKMKAALKPGGRLVIVEPIAPSRRAGSRDEQVRNHEIAPDFVKQDVREAGFSQALFQDPFTTRRHLHSGNTEATDEEWLLAVTPASAAQLSWSASKDENWMAADLRISIEDYKKLAATKDVLMLDVRDREMYRAGHLPGAVLMTVQELAAPETLARLKNETRPVIAYCSCEIEQSSARAAIILRKAGVRTALALVGGYEEWVRRGDPVVKGDTER